MALYQIVLPKMGESVAEATLISYNINVGDHVEEDDTIADVATDKVDTEIPSPVSGIVKELLHKKDDLIKVGQVLAVIEMAGAEGTNKPSLIKADETIINSPTSEEAIPQEAKAPNKPASKGTKQENKNEIFLSPLVKNIVAQENLKIEDISKIKGTGVDNRITKNDILNYIDKKQTIHNTETKSTPIAQPKVAANPTDTVIQMDRMRKLIADHMVMSKKVSPHVTTFLEVDVTNLVNWRKAIKEDFLSKHQQRITFTPIFFHLIAKAVLDFPLINSTIDGDNIIVKKNINIGMAAALPSGNLIVPVLKNVDHKSIIGLATEINQLTAKARSNALAPDDVKHGTLTVSNIGTFGNDAGTPIINQPQAAIIALGAINKKPAVVETHIGDIIAIRQRMILSISFDHRIIDGYYGGSFLRKVGDYFEAFDPNTKI